MQVSKVNNQPNFGIRCINENSLNKKAFEILRKSKLAKEIDNLYPEASANYFFFEHAKDNELQHIGDKIRTLLFDINLSKNKVWHMQVDTKQEQVPLEFLQDKFETLTLNDLEEGIKNQTTTVFQHKTAEEKPSKIKNFIKKLVKALNI